MHEANETPLPPPAERSHRISLVLSMLGLVAMTASLSACDGSAAPDPVVAPDPDPDVAPDPAPDRTLTSISTIAFGPGDILFAADVRAGIIYAIDTGSPGVVNEDAHFNLYNADSLIADHLGVPWDKLEFNALAVHPQTTEVFIAVTYDDGKDLVPSILKVAADGTVADVDLTKSTSFALADPISEEVTFWGRVSARTLSVTDMDYDDGFLYVAGLTNADFASTLYKIPYPFAGTSAMASVGIYHAGHGQTETRAPIRTQTIVELGGEKYLIAAYTCTPLVAIPLADVQDGAHITGKTIAELGWGNEPNDLVHLSFHNPFIGQDEDVLVLTNRHRGTMQLRLADVESATELPGLTEPAGLDAVGVPYSSLPLHDGVVHLSRQGASRVLMLRRNFDTGHLDLLSLHQGIWLRLSEYIAEYDFTGWEPNPDGSDEGLAEFTRWLATEEGIDPDSIDTGRW